MSDFRQNDAIKIAKEVNYSKGITDALISLYTIYNEKGDFENALSSYKKYS